MNHIALLKGIKNDTERKSQIHYLLEKVNLWDFKNKEVHTFSGGMKQRFGVAQALLGEPKIIIVDEPTAGLDPEERNRFNSLLNDISTEVIVILSTHLVEDVRNLCSEMTIINKGEIVKTGKPKELISELDNKVWSKSINKSELELYQSNFHVISQQLVERELQITIFSEEQPMVLLPRNHCWNTFIFMHSLKNNNSKMNSIFRFELTYSSKRWLTYLTAIILLLAGVFSGNKFTLTAGEGIYLNSPYTIGFMLGMLSLSIIFFAILYSTQLLFKEWDAKFDLVVFSLPFSKMTYLNGKFWFFYLKTFLSFLLLVFGFVIGQELRTGSEMQVGFNAWHYLYPLFVFGILNSFFVCSFLFFISYTTNRKLLVVVGGLLLYVLYMVLLVFSNSPFMSGSTPQSIEVQQISALIRPIWLIGIFL